MPEETTQRRATAQELPTNPFVDVGMILFLEDIAEKQGVEGLMTYMMNQGAALADAMPSEDYAVWDDFVAAVNEGRSIISALEGTQHFAGNVFVTAVNPFHEAYATYIRLMGELLPLHREAVDLYNGRVQNAAVESMNLIHQPFRRALVKRITVAGQPIRYAELAVKGFDGNIRTAPEGWLEVLLERAGITATQLQMAIRQNSLVTLIYPPVASAQAVDATALTPTALGLKDTEELDLTAEGNTPQPVATAAAASNGERSQAEEE
ncbi:MAG: hypothetical protein IIA23_10295 [Chloroflexi bacterium]|nr:hypothetical protein [Chloroflexota bacterium]